MFPPGRKRETLALTTLVTVLVLAAIIFSSLNSLQNTYPSNRPAGIIPNTSVPQSSTQIFDFSLSNSGGISISGISSGSTTIIARLASGPAQQISLSCTSQLPPDSACIFTPATSSPSFNGTLTITIRPTTPIGSYPVTVTGAGGGQTHTTTVTLTIFYPPPSGVIGGNLVALDPVTILAPFALLAIVAVTSIFYLERRARKPEK